VSERPDCCAAPRWSDARHDLGHAGGFDLVLLTCAGCGASWMDLFSEAATAGGIVRVADADAARMRAMAPGAERKAAMKAWVLANE
jgi:hypothetical protein